MGAIVAVVFVFGDDGTAVVIIGLATGAGGTTGTTNGLATGTTIGVATGTTTGVATGATVGLATGTTTGVATGTTTGVATGVLTGILVGEGAAEGDETGTVVDPQSAGGVSERSTGSLGTCK